MREAIISLSDEELETIGFGDLISHCRQAGLLDVELLEDDGTRSIPQIEVENQLDGDRLDSIECVEDWELVSETPNSYLYILELLALEMPEGITQDHEDLVGVCDPTVSDRGMLLSLVGSQETIRRIIRHFEQAGATPGLEKLGEYESGTGKFESLTERQHEVLQTAYKMGFYEVPRAASVDDVAAELGLEGATVSEHLQRAERNLISQQLTASD